MKTITLKLFLTSLLTLLMSIPSWSADGTIFTATVTGSTQYKIVKFKIISEANKTCQVGDGTNIALDNTDISGTVIIPSTVSYGNNDYTVTAIADNAFSGCTKISNVTMPGTVTSIGIAAFSGCSALRYALLPEGVVSIGDDAYAYCSSLEQLSLPSSLRSIGKRAFWECTVLSGYNGQVAIPEGITTIEDWLFYGCSGIQKLTIPSTVTSIGTGAFMGTSQLRNVFSNITTPFTLASGIFTDSGCYLLVVPSGTRDAYVSAGWNSPFTLVSEPATITINNSSRYYGAANPSFTYSVVGGPLDSNPYLSCSANANSSVGTYSIQGSATGVVPVTFTNTGTLTVNKKPVTITAKAQTITYGNSISTGTSQVTTSTNGLVNGHSLSSITLTPSTSNITTNGTITPSAATITYNSTDVTANYSITYNTGKLTINAKSVYGLTVDAIAAQTYTGSAITPTVTVWDGNNTLISGTDYTVSYSNNTNAGTATITITGQGNYTGTKTVNFTINKKDVTITANNQSIAYGSSISTGTSQVTCSGLLNGHTLYSVTLTPSTSNVTSNGTITPSSATIKNGSTTVTSNYNITYNTGLLTISGKNVSDLTVNSIAAVTYSGLAQTPTVTVKDGNTTLTEGTHYTVSYSNNTNAGTATVTITGSGNYTGTRNVNFTINKAPLTITAKSYTIDQGDALPTFEITYSGFQNSETSTVLTTQPVISCDAASSSTPGEYDINVSGAEAQNYAMTYVKGTLTIEATSVSITINSLGKGTYCSEYPLNFTNVSGIEAYIISGFKPSAGNLIITRAYEVPAGTGLYIVGTPENTYNVPVEPTDFYYSNMMKGVTVATVIPANEDGYTNYVLSSDGHGGVIFKHANNASLSANRAYVQIPSSTAGAREFLGIETDDDSTTGLDGIFSSDTKEAEGDYYNLSGQKVQTPQRGIYIKNGKKIFIH